MKSRFTSWLSLTGGAVLILLLVLGLNWAFRTVVPVRPTAGTPAQASGSQPEMTVTPTLVPTPSPALLQSTEGIEGEQVGLFPNARFVLSAALPDQPQQVLLYQHQIPDELVNPESARQMAERIGVQGGVYSSSSEGSDTLLTVADGTSQLLFMNFPEQFVYTGNYQTVLAKDWHQTDFSTQAAAVEALLQKAGLLDLPYRAEPLGGARGEVHLVPLLDDGTGEQRPVLYGIGYNPGLSEWVQAEVTSGQVNQLYYSGLHLKPLGTYPIISAQQAWERLSGSRAANWLCIRSRM